MFITYKNNIDHTIEVINQVVIEQMKTTIDDSMNEETENFTEMSINLEKYTNYVEDAKKGKELYNKKLKGGQRYCSEECKVKRREEKKLKRRKEKLIKCEECEALFYPVNSNIKYCSMECKNKAHSSRMTGLNNSNYKTGENYKSEFIKIREKIKARDNFKCRYCMCEEEIITYLSKGEEKKKSNLVIHHIDENKHNNSESNLLTLCASCHITLHKTKKK